ncbi:hypothetical protein [Streptomyces scabiei]|uniref:hypothetical protein n=1 Tax=Streptomyces scabiei TaxID=1930 RepID=UPI0029B3D611|nr:hypothetical protein [Streptomyces scabiei]MDX3115847.1 hypothetical protein [Streptomyces scabiei]
MLRHEFRPGRLIAGASFVLAGVIFAGDVGGLWEAQWFVMIPVIMAGLCLAGVTGAVAGGVRRRRVRSGRTTPTGADPTTSP